MASDPTTRLECAETRSIPTVLISRHAVLPSDPSYSQSGLCASQPSPPAIICENEAPQVSSYTPTISRKHPSRPMTAISGQARSKRKYFGSSRTGMNAYPGTRHGNEKACPEHQGGPQLQRETGSLGRLGHRRQMSNLPKHLSNLTSYLLAYQQRI